MIKSQLHKRVILTNMTIKEENDDYKARVYRCHQQIKWHVVSCHGKRRVIPMNKDAIFN